jgi:hypothetical protein
MGHEFDEKVNGADVIAVKDGIVVDALKVEAEPGVSTTAQINN